MITVIPSDTTPTKATLTTLNIDLKLKALMNFNTATTYAVDIKIANEQGGIKYVWGDTVSATTPITWETCSGGNIRIGGQVPPINNFDLAD
jgi:hypothetical protein